MNTAKAVEVVSQEIGAALGGGFITGRVLVDQRPYLIITAPRAEEPIVGRWNKNLKCVDGSRSFFDGLANTRAMAEAGSEIARQVLALRIAGFDDWYIPSRDELELQYRAFKPTKRENYVYRNGDNPSSLPPGYPYTEALPAQTTLQLFQEGEREAFDAAWHWSSTQYEAGSGFAWLQDFDGGNQPRGHKGDEFTVRAVRRVDPSMIR